MTLLVTSVPGVSQMGLGFIGVEVMSCPPEKTDLLKPGCLKKQHIGVHLLRDKNPPGDHASGNTETFSSELKVLPGAQAVDALSQKPLKYKEVVLL